jgi:hypothetical protein
MAPAHFTPFGSLSLAALTAVWELLYLASAGFNNAATAIRRDLNKEAQI